jgi:4-amino-4-deoxy-L-arabinose transferase-like glycosyltransferase
VIRAVTAIARSDAPFWVRLPGPLFHAATALILALTASRLWGRTAAVWTAMTYVTLPFTAVGSILVSTDTIMAPFFAAAIHFHLRMIETRAPRHAILTGLMIGVAFLAKYAALYALGAVAVAALFSPAARIGWRNAALVVLAFALVASPNVWWNLTHGLTTVNHTLDNVRWVREADPESGMDLGDLRTFLLGQFAVFSPILVVALVGALVSGWPRGQRWLAAFVVPVLLIVTFQAFLDRAYANWAISAYFAGMLIVVSLLLARAPWLLAIAVVVNLAVTLALPLITVFGTAWTFGASSPVLHRYLGRASLSRQALSAAETAGVGTILADDRDVLADLFYTGRDSGIAIRAMPFVGRPMNYYEQNFPLADDVQGQVFAILAGVPTCDGSAVAPVAKFDTTGGAFRRVAFAGYLIGADCARKLS